MNAASKPVLENRAKEANKDQRDALITEHFNLIRVIASHVQKSLGVHTELEDLIHAGTMGLFDAATKYREDKEVPFALYAKHRIRGAILDSLRQLDWASRDARRHYKQMEAVTRELTAKLNRNPTQLEIAEAMGLDARRWQSLMTDFRTFGFAAAQQKSAEREDQPAKEVPCAAADCPDQVFQRAELRKRLGLAMKKLPERYQQVVKLYYEGDMTMKEIGSALGVNESRVSQIHKSALEKMQTILGGAGVRSAAAFVN
jgi:RNA polymerase sigma factor for flagellar operon FliA